MAFNFTDENANEIIATGKPVVIDFWATWCGPCQAMSPIIDKLAKEYDPEQIVIGKYNTDDQNDFCVQNRVMGIPAILFFKNGKPTNIRLTGLQKEETLRAKIEELLKL